MSVEATQSPGAIFVAWALEQPEPLLALVEQLVAWRAIAIDLHRSGYQRDVVPGGKDPMAGTKHYRQLEVAARRRIADARIRRAVEDTLALNKPCNERTRNDET